MDSSVSEIQFPESGEGSYTIQSKYSNDLSSNSLCTDSGDDMQSDKILHNPQDNSSLRSEEPIDSSDAAYGSYDSTSGCLPLHPSENITSNLLDSMKLPNTAKCDEAHKNTAMDSKELEASQEDKMDTHENNELLVAKSEEMVHVETFIPEVPSMNKQHLRGENLVVSESVAMSTSDETPIKPEINVMFELEEYNGDTEVGLDFQSNDSVTEVSFKNNADVSKLEILSEDEEVNFPKSGAESSSSKGESPSGPSCSGTSHRDINSLSSDSEDDLPDINMSLPLKKRKRESRVETISSSDSSCSEDESKADIDYSNLTPEQIRTLIEQAKSIRHKCRCPKRKLADLPVKGPTEPSSRCNIGKGDWTEKKPCPDCASGFCNEAHKHGRSGRRRYTHTRSALAKSRARGTIGQDVPIIDLSDEEVSPVSNRVASEVTVATAPLGGECIVLSSSDDDSDIVCEGIIKPDTKPQETQTIPLGGSPDVVVLPSVGGSLMPSAAPAHPAALSASVTAPPALPVLPDPAGLALGTDLDLLDFDLDNDIWNMNLFPGFTGSSSAGGMTANSSQASASTAAPERPASPEGWTCPICLESKTAVPEIMSTTCGHIFCGTCIRSAVRIHKKCPTCRKKLTAKQFHKIFL